MAHPIESKREQNLELLGCIEPNVVKPEHKRLQGGNFLEEKHLVYFDFQSVCQIIHLHTYCRLPFIVRRFPRRQNTPLYVEIKYKHRHVRRFPPAVRPALNPRKMAFSLLGVCYWFLLFTCDPIHSATWSRRKRQCSALHGSEKWKIASRSHSTWPQRDV